MKIVPGYTCITVLQILLRDCQERKNYPVEILRSKQVIHLSHSSFIWHFCVNIGNKVNPILPTLMQILTEFVP
jgi:hypothetical protein